MAKCFSVSEIKDMDDGSIVNMFKGTVNKLWEQKTGTNNRGDWSLQSFMCEDSEGEEIKVTLKDRDELPSSFEGKSICILAYKGTKGWSGVYAKDDSYNGKTTRILWVTGTAEITKGSGTSSRENEPDEREGERENDRGHEREEREEPRSQRKFRDEDQGREERSSRREEREPDGDPIEDAKARLGQLGNLFGLCLDEACKIATFHEQRNKLEMTPEQFQGITTTLYISMDRSGYADEMPSESISNEPEPEEKPKKGKRD